MSTTQTTPVNANMFNAYAIAVERAKQTDEYVSDDNAAVNFRPLGVSGLEPGDVFIIHRNAIFRDTKLSKAAITDPNDPNKIVKAAVDVFYAIAEIVNNSPDVLKPRDSAKVYLSTFHRTAFEYRKTEDGQLVATGRPKVSASGTFVDYLTQRATDEQGNTKPIPVADYCEKPIRVDGKVRVDVRNFDKTDLTTRNIFTFNLVE